MSQRSLYELILESADAALALRNPDGSFPAGTNGPHNHRETRLRNSCHWLVVLAWAARLYKCGRFEEAGASAVEYILRSEHRPYGYTFMHRPVEGVDRCNGLIGQAWVIEALVEAYRSFGHKESLLVAVDTFKMHPYDYRAGLWRRVEVNGSSAKGFDLTLNHQVWFAAAAADLAQYSQGVEDSVLSFLDKLEDHIECDEAGLFQLPVSTFSMLKRGRVISAARTSGLRQRLRTGASNHRARLDLREKLVGYHSFNLYGLARLHCVYPDHSLWRSVKISKSIGYLLQDDFVQEAFRSRFGGSYNPPGFESAYAIEEFGAIIGGDVGSVIRMWLSRQFRDTYSSDSKMLTNVICDPVTHAARIYEATRLRDYMIDLGV